VRGSVASIRDNTRRAGFSETARRRPSCIGAANRRRRLQAWSITGGCIAQPNGCELRLRSRQCATGVADTTTYGNSHAAWLSPSVFQCGPGAATQWGVDGGTTCEASNTSA
jgi:hypothetical protein